MKYPAPKRPDRTLRIWRYISLDKLLDLLLTRTIKFTQVSIAADQDEISLPLKSILQDDEFEQKHGKSAKQYIEKIRATSYMSCWTQKETESRFFWHSYLHPSHIGVAIKSTVEKVLDSIDFGDFSFDYRLVEYRNEFEPEELQSQTILVNTKGASYKEEDEIRFLISGLDLHRPKSRSLEDTADYVSLMDSLLSQNPSTNFPKVISLGIDILKSTEEIWISPYCSSWQKKTIKDTISLIEPNLSHRIFDSSINEKI